MNTEFDELAKAIGRGLTRRQALKALSGAIIGIFWASVDNKSVNASDLDKCRDYCSERCKIPGISLFGKFASVNLGCIRGCLDACVPCAQTDPANVCPYNRLLGPLNVTFVCTNLKEDPKNCGHCWSECDTPNCCNGACVTLASDRNNCGSCGNRCPVNEQCYNGSCCHFTRYCNGSCCPAGSSCRPRLDSPDRNHPKFACCSTSQGCAVDCGHTGNCWCNTNKPGCVV